MTLFNNLFFFRVSLQRAFTTHNAVAFYNSIQIQVYLYSAFYNTIVAKQLYRKLSFYNIFIYRRNLIYLTFGKIW